LAGSVWRKDVIGWSLYDLANTIYSMNILSLYLKRYIIEDLGRDDRWFDIPYSISMLIAAVVLPALGAMSDHSAKKKIFVFLFTLTCCSAVGLMAAVPPSMILIVIVLFIIANFSYEAGQPFYNALLYSVADSTRARYVSGIGVAFGYIGSVLGMILVLPFVTGSIFGLDVPFVDGVGKVGAFVPTAVLFLLLSLPLLFWVHEVPRVKPKAAGWKLAYAEVWNGLRQTKQYPGVLRFLISDYFFEDAVVTVIINIGLYCSLVLGLPDDQITLFLIVSTLSAVVGSFLLGWISQFVSLKKLLAGVVWGWIVALVAFVLTDSMAVIWILGSLVGILLGGLWTTSRPLLGELVPKAELGRFYGLFSLSGRTAAVIGPLIWTTVVYLFHTDRTIGRYFGEAFGLSAETAVKLPYKMGILSLVVMMAIGLFLFRRVPDTQQRASHG